MTRWYQTSLLAAALMFSFAAAAHAQITIDTSDAIDWKISNGAIYLDWNPTTGHVYDVQLAGHSDRLVDTTTTQSGQPMGLYMDNSGVGSGTTTAGYALVPGRYLDWHSTRRDRTT